MLKLIKHCFIFCQFLLRLGIVSGLAFSAFNAHSHEVRPSYLELIQLTPQTYSVYWKVPAKGDLRIGLYVQFEDDVITLTEPVERFSSGSYISQWQISHVAGLIGSEVKISGLQSTFTETLIRVEKLDGTIQVDRLMPEKPSFKVLKTPSSFDVAKTYTGLGIKHILVGFDHLLFLVCLILISGSAKRILITVTGFTLSHSITLALSALNIVNLKVAPVEAIIALSIVFLASEIAKGKRDTLTWKYPVAISSSFGLLHGFGFAAVLNDIGLPQTELATGLFFFNVGVEVGQLLFIAGLLMIMVLFKCFTIDLKQALLQKPAAYLVGGLASFWLIERSISFIV